MENNDYKGNEIKLNEILNIEKNILENTIIRFIKPTGTGDFDPINIYLMDEEEAKKSILWNYKNNNHIYKLNDVAIGFIRLKSNKDHWLLFDIAKIIEVYGDVKEGIGYKSETLEKYKNFLGRVIVNYHSTASYPHELIKRGADIINEISVVKILAEKYTISDEFPGYKNIDLSWAELTKVVEKEKWIPKLQNRKGIYLIVNTKEGKYYVGKASGNGGFFQRWNNYVSDGHGGDVKIKEIVEKDGFDYIKNFFRYTILETIEDDDPDYIDEREQWWKKILMTNKFGHYNNN